MRICSPIGLTNPAFHRAIDVHREIVLGAPTLAGCNVLAFCDKGGVGKTPDRTGEEFGELRNSWPAFDYAFAMYWAVHYRNEPMSVGSHRHGLL